MQVIDFNDVAVRKEHFRKCIRFLFDAKTQVHDKEKMKEQFAVVRHEVVFEAIPALYRDRVTQQELTLHEDFVCDIEEIFIEWNQPPHFWSCDYDDFIKAHRLWL